MSDGHRRFAIPLPRRAPAVGGGAEDGETPLQRGTRTLAEAVVDCAYYEAGARKGGRLSVDEALHEIDVREEGFVWIGLHDPAPEVVEAVGERFGLPPLAVEDAVHAHQRPKLELFDDARLSIIFKTTRYTGARELVEVGELMLFIGPEYVVTVRHGNASPLRGIREDLEAHPDILELGPSGVLYAVADRIVDDYGAVLERLSRDVEQIEDQVFSPDVRDPTERVYRLKREVLEFQRAVVPLRAPVEQLAQGTVAPLDSRSTSYFRDVCDHLVRDIEQTQGFSELLTSVLSANVAQLSIRANQDMRKISAWLAVIAVPTMIFGLYGMNFDEMPELRWELGYPVVLVIVIAICGALYGRFKRAGWL